MIITFPVRTRESSEPQISFTVWATNYARSWRSPHFVNAYLCYGIGFDSAVNWRYQTRPPLLYRHKAIALRIAR